MKQQTEPFSLQLPLTLDCSENGPIEHAQALFAQIQPGDEVYVKVTEIDDQGRINLSRKDAMNDLAKKGKIK